MSESEFKSEDPNAFLRQQQQAAADEALLAVVCVGEPIPTPGEPDEEAQFQAHMRRFPRPVRVLPLVARSSC